MKRSFLMSALVLALAAAMPACGGGSATGDAKTGDDAKKDDGGSDKGSDDPVVELKNISTDVQKAVDDVLAPIKNADDVLDSVTKLPADLKAMKSKADPKKVMAELKKLLDGGEPQLEALKLEDDAKAKVQERVDKVKALINSAKNIDENVKNLGAKLADAVTKVPLVGGKAMAKLEVTLKNPLAGGDAKKKAEEDKKALGDIVDGFKGKVSGWQKDMTELPPKAKDLPKRLATAFSK